MTVKKLRLKCFICPSCGREIGVFIPAAAGDVQCRKCKMRNRKGKIK